MQAIEMTTANSKANILDMIDALQNILACSQVTIPDLETPYSSFPNTDQSIHQDHISAIINERQKQLDAVLHEISGMETVVDGLKNLHQQLVEKKDRITQSLNIHKRFGSTLWRLPTEVLSQFFYHCLPKDRMLWFSPSSREAPMLLTEVCRGWREVAVGIPGLWRKLYMQVNKSDWQEVAFCYDSWLKRSRGCRLSLQLNCNADDSIKLRSLVQPYINQITSLCIYFFSNVVQPELLLIDLPALQELKIRNFDPSVSQYISQMPSTLRSLDVTGSWFNFEHLSSFDPVCANLTNIGIDIYSPNEFHHLLQLCPNLSSLTVSVRRRFYRTMTLEPFTHSEIRSIRFVYSLDVLPLSNLFDVLSLPNLRVFEAQSGDKWPHEQFKAFLLRSKCPLESLIFSGRLPTLTDEERAEYIALFPSLEVVYDSDFESFR